MKTLFIVVFLLGCGIIAKTQSPNWAWAKNADGMETNYASAICNDKQGYVYATGAFDRPNIILGNDTLTDSLIYSSRTSFIVKYDSWGNVIWLKSLPPGPYSRSICTDILGNIYITGGFSDSVIVFGTDTLTNHFLNGSGVFVAKYNASGNILWAKGGAGGVGYNSTQAICADAMGNVYITGLFHSNLLIFDADTLLNKLSYMVYGSAIFVAKFDSSGNELWANKAGGDSSALVGYTNVADQGSGIIADADGNVFVTGMFNSPGISFGNYYFENYAVHDHDDEEGTYDENVFLVKYSNTGEVLWAKGVNDYINSFGSGVSIDSHNNVYITGTFSGSPIIFDTFSLYDPDNESSFLAKYNPSGAVVWALNTGSYGGQGISIDAGDNIYIENGFDIQTFMANTMHQEMRFGKKVFLMLLKVMEGG